MSNEPRSAYDLYTPRFVKGVGINKVGLCPLCFEPKYRGGNGTIEWLAMKVSAYKWYVSSFLSPEPHADEYMRLEFLNFPTFIYLIYHTATTCNTFMVYISLYMRMR